MQGLSVTKRSTREELQRRESIPGCGDGNVEIIFRKSKKEHVKNIKEPQIMTKQKDGSGPTYSDLVEESTRST